MKIMEKLQDKVFFCNSGAEANEGAIKLAYKYHNGNRVEESHYVSGGSLLMWKESCIYDSKGNKIESNIYNINGTGGNSAYMYEYDKTGNWVKCTKFRDDKPETITERIIKYFP